MTQADDILDRTLREVIQDPILAHHFYAAMGTDLDLSLDSVPAQVRGFEDLAFLFASNEFSMRAALLALDEAAYLYRLAGDVSGGAVVEIGRYRGGATFLLAAATRGRCQLYSYDKHISMPWETRFDGERGDLILWNALTRASMVDHVTLVVGDSAASEPLPEPVKLVFVDGDHSYTGVMSDFEHWSPTLEIGAHLVFHDAKSRLLQHQEEGVAEAVAEIRRDSATSLQEIEAPGTLVHFVRSA